MDDKITINEIVELFKSEGFRITRRMVWYYIDRGIFPKPVTQRGEKGVSGYYHKDMLEQMRQVLRWRDEGRYSLDELPNKLQLKAADEADKLFKEYGIEHFFDESIDITDEIPLLLHTNHDLSYQRFILKLLDDDASEREEAHRELQKPMVSEFLKICSYRIGENTMWFPKEYRRLPVIDFVLDYFSEKLSGQLSLYLHYEKVEKDLLDGKDGALQAGLEKVREGLKGEIFRIIEKLKRINELREELICKCGDHRRT